MFGTWFVKNFNQGSHHLRDKNVYKGDIEVEFYHHDLENIQLARIKPSLAVVWYQIH